MKNENGQWTGIYAQAQGESHTVCQDYTGCLMGEVNVVALADGLTTCAQSHKGARIVVEAVCQEIQKHYREYCNKTRTARKLVQVLQDAVRAEARSEDRYFDMSSTLLFCATDADTYLVGHIGDGAIAQFGKESRLICAPQQTPVGGTCTYTILDKDAAERMVLLTGSMEDLDGFLLTSDGLKGVTYGASGVVLPATAFRFFRMAYDLQELPQEERNRKLKGILERFSAEQGADDCSVAVLSRRVMTGHTDYSVENGYNPNVKWHCTCGKTSALGEIRCGKCARELATIYAPVEIYSYGGFFTELERWLQSGTSQPMRPSPQSGRVRDRDAFDGLCRILREGGTAKPAEPVQQTQALCHKFILQKEDLEEVYLLRDNVLIGPGDLEQTFPSAKKAFAYVSGRFLNGKSPKGYRKISWECELTNPVSDDTPPTLDQVLEQIEQAANNSMLNACGEDYLMFAAMQDYAATLTILSTDEKSKAYACFLLTEWCVWMLDVDTRKVLFSALSHEEFGQLMNQLQG
mgnify:CR=1 FL=1